MGLQASKGLLEPSALLTLPLSHTFPRTGFTRRTIWNTEDTSMTLIAQWAHILHSLLLKCLERFSSLCSVRRELNGIRPLSSARWGNNLHAKLVCRECVSIVFEKRYVESECMFKDMPGRDVVRSNFHINIASCPRNPRKCENQETDLHP